MMKPELCEKCMCYGVYFYIDPQIGGYTKCKYCGDVVTEADVVEDDGE